MLIFILFLKMKHVFFLPKEGWLVAWPPSRSEINTVRAVSKKLQEKILMYVSTG